jgi:hypothetical protein
MPDGRLLCLFWRCADALDYWVFQLRLFILDAICGPEPPTAADQECEWDAVGSPKCLAEHPTLSNRRNCLMRRRPCRRQVPFPYT